MLLSVPLQPSELWVWVRKKPYGKLRLWNRVIFFKFHQCGSTTGDCAPYNHRCCPKASKSWRTGDAVEKFSVWLFLPFSFQNEEKYLKKRPFCTFGRKQCLCLVRLVREYFKKLSFKNNKNRNFKTLYLKC